MIRTVALHINDNLLWWYFFPLMLNGVMPQENEHKKIGLNMSYNMLKLDALKLVVATVFTTSDFTT